MSSYIDVLELGADPTGNSLNTHIIQKALDMCMPSGGHVYVPPGDYLTGTLYLRDNTVLELAPGSRILGSKNIDDYPSDIEVFKDACGATRGKGLLVADSVSSITLCGAGCIDGQGDVFPDLSHRPMLLRFLDCKHVTVKDVKLLNSGSWVQHYFRCEDVRVHGINVLSYSNANNDGIDIDSCRGVLISDCVFRCGDDALTLKTTTDSPLQEVVVNNCIISSNCNGIKFGTESIGDCENVTISNCCVTDTRLSGITLACVDGASLRNLIISDITMKNVGAAFFIRLGDRKYDKKVQNNKIGIINNIILQNIVADNVGPIGSSIMGLQDSKIQDISLTDIRISTEGGIKDLPGTKLREQPGIYPEFDRWGNLPAYGIYCRHVEDLFLDNVKLEAMDFDARPKIFFEDVICKNLAKKSD